jgi:hypothetical protein
MASVKVIIGRCAVPITGNRTSHSSGRRVSLPLIENLRGFEVVFAAAQFQRWALVSYEAIMKILILIIAILVLSACHAPTSKSEGTSAQMNPTMNTSTANNSSSTPNDVSRGQSEAEAQNERSKIAPEEFKQIDFKNYSYPYKFDYGRKFNIVLKNGENEYDFENDRGWFNLSDVYYVDLTNDGKPEAIAMLWHVSCGVSCDGGAGLFYIYTVHQNKLKPIWQFETGSMKYGCGLKSFIVKNRKITMELFRRCSNVRDESGATFQAEDITSFTFVFNGRKIVEERREFISAPERDTKNYKPEISISD